jgi:hypothetical protein
VLVASDACVRDLVSELAAGNESLQIRVFLMVQPGYRSLVEVPVTCAACLPWNESPPKRPGHFVRAAS